MGLRSPLARCAAFGLALLSLASLDGGTSERPGAVLDAAKMLAPGPGELLEALDRLLAAAEDAEAVGAATARLENAVAEARARLVRPEPCSKEIGSLIAREAVFVSAHRDAIQHARVLLARVEEMAGSATLERVVASAGWRADIEEAGRRVRDQIPVHLEMASWHAREATPVLRACRPPLEPAPGVPGGALPARGERSALTAVIALGGGRICPEGNLARGGVVVLQEPLACYAEDACDCTAARVDPGAVLGP